MCPFQQILKRVFYYCTQNAKVIFEPYGVILVIHVLAYLNIFEGMIAKKNQTELKTREALVLEKIEMTMGTT